MTVRGVCVKNPLTIIAGVVMLLSALVVLVFVFELSGDGLTEGQTNMVLLSVVSLVANAVPSVLALLKAEATQNDLRNGVVKEKVKEAIVEVAQDTDVITGQYKPTDRQGDHP